MFGFKDFLIVEAYENVHKSIARDLIIEQVCLNSLKLIPEFWQNIRPDGQANYDSGEFEGDLDSEKFPDSNAKPIEEIEPPKEPDPAEKEKANQENLRDLQKKLRDAILILRWNAMTSRAAEIKQLQRFRDEYIKDYGNPFPTSAPKPELAADANVTENTEEDDDDEEFASSRFNQMMSRGTNQSQSQSQFDVMSAVPLLEKLGYIKLDDLYEEGLDDEEVKKAVTAALFKAAAEEDNNPPKVVNSEEVNKAKQIFFDSVKQIFRGQFRKIVRSQTSKVSLKDGSTADAYQLYDPGESYNNMIDDIANAFSLKMYETFTSRSVSNGTPQPWLRLKADKKDIGFGDEAEELDDERTVDVLINYIRSTLKHFYSNEQRKQKLANSPAAATEDLQVWGGNRDKKANLINSDIESNNLNFYKTYITKDSLEVEERLNELRRKLKETKKLSAGEHQEKWRLEIISQIIFEHSKHSESLSLDPDKIIQTLQFYRGNFLGKKYRVQSFFGAMGKKTDDGEGDIDATASLGDSGSNRDRGQSSFPNPAGYSANQEMKRALHQKLIGALNAMRAERTGKEHALAICVFWELGNCALDAGPTNIDNFSNLIIHVSDQEEKELEKIRKKKASGQQLTPEEMKKEMKYSSCEYILFNHLRSAGDGRKGKSIQQANQEINKILGYEVPENTFRSWLNNGVKYICNYMKGQRSSLSVFAPSTASTTQSRKFDPARQSPLSRLRVPKVTTDPDSGEKKYEPTNADQAN